MSWQQLSIFPLLSCGKNPFGLQVICCSAELVRLSSPIILSYLSLPIVDMLSKDWRVGRELLGLDWVWGQVLHHERWEKVKRSSNHQKTGIDWKTRSVTFLGIYSSALEGQTCIHAQFTHFTNTRIFYSSLARSGVCNADSFCLICSNYSSLIYFHSRAVEVSRIWFVALTSWKNHNVQLKLEFLLCL